jgi:hypothetical protein
MLACASCGGGGKSGGKTGGGASSWAMVFQGLPGALISVDGTSAHDVWLAGADTRDKKGALVLHYDGKTWLRRATGIEADLWWVHVFAKDSVYFGGAKGTIAHYDGTAFTRMDTPGKSTVYGIWGASEDEIWAVGGEPDVSPGFVWRWDGKAWNDMTAMLPPQKSGDAIRPALFKVWGQAADDLWIVGYEGTTVHWNGSAFEAADSGTDQPLFTVSGAHSGDPKFVTVGGDSSALILEGDGTHWHNVSPHDPQPPLVGVFVRSADQAYAVGDEGTVLQRQGAAWKLLDTGQDLFNPFHSVWVDPDGGVWCVGGDVQSATPSDGMMMHRGSAVPHEFDEEGRAVASGGGTSDDDAGS